MNSCSYCGHPNGPSRVHCGNCGERLPTPPDPPPETTSESIPPEPIGAAAVPVPAPRLPVGQVEPDAAEFTKHFYAATPRLWVTGALIGLNCLIFLLTGLESSNLTHPNLAALLDWGANWGPLTTTDGGWWRLLAAVFLHYTLFHLLCNMFAFWQAGLLAERLFGNGFFLAVYLGAGVASSLTALDWHPDVISAGASGAVFGVYGALLGYLVRQRGDVPRRIWASLGKTILAFIALNLVYGVTQLKVDNAAHVGGLLAGLLIGWAAARPLRQPHRQACNRRTALQLCLMLLLLSVPLVARIPLVRPSYAKLLNDMGESIARGSSGPRDPAAAAWWYTQAARLGSADAEYNLGRHFFSSDSGAAFNPAAGLKWFRQAAARGSTHAEISLGIIYYNGNGVPADHAEALRWIARVAQAGEAGEQFMLGQMYYQGDGAAKDYDAAFKWMHLAADQGLPVAQAQLAAMYFKGEGTATNTSAAARWARAAAIHGQPNAQYILGTLYATGQGVARDEVEAYAWFSLAASSPAPLAPAAGKVVSQLALDMTSAQLDGARLRVKELTQKITSLTRPPSAAP